MKTGAQKFAVRADRVHMPKQVDTAERVAVCLGCKVPQERCKGLCFSPGCKDVRPLTAVMPTGGEVAVSI